MKTVAGPAASDDSRTRVRPRHRPVCSGVGLSHPLHPHDARHLGAVHHRGPPHGATRLTRRSRRRGRRDNGGVSGRWCGTGGSARAQSDRHRLVVERRRAPDDRERLGAPRVREPHWGSGAARGWPGKRQAGYQQGGRDHDDGACAEPASSLTAGVAEQRTSSSGPRPRDWPAHSRRDLQPEQSRVLY